MGRWVGSHCDTMECCAVVLPFTALLDALVEALHVTPSSAGHAVLD